MYITVNTEKWYRQVMVRIGQYFIIARTLCNSRADGGQRHCSDLFLQRIEQTLPGRL